jgi:hypothetical protein
VFVFFSIQLIHSAAAHSHTRANIYRHGSLISAIDFLLFLVVATDIWLSVLPPPPFLPFASVEDPPQCASRPECYPRYPIAIAKHNPISRLNPCLLFCFQPKMLLLPLRPRFGGEKKKKGAGGDCPAVREQSRVGRRRSHPDDRGFTVSRHKRAAVPARGHPRQFIRGSKTKGSILQFLFFFSVSVPPYVAIPQATIYDCPSKKGKEQKWTLECVSVMAARGRWNGPTGCVLAATVT